MTQTIHVLLMAGGQGTRLWPKSRRALPKQFMTLRNQPSLFQQTLMRMTQVVDTCHLYVVHLYVVVSPEYVPWVEQQAPALTPGQIIVEPSRHGTLASLGFALTWLQSAPVSDSGLPMDSEDIVVLLPTDAYVDDEVAFQKCLLDSVEVAKSTSAVVTIGVRPDYPATGYGYIYTGSEWLGPAQRVLRFIEKPSLDDAQRYSSDPRYLWNAGIFVWQASVVWQLFRHYQPETLHRLQQWAKDWTILENEKLKRQYEELPNIPFEYALVEKATDIYVVPAPFQWTDLGTWTALLEHVGLSAHDSESPVLILDAKRCLVANEEGLVALLGVEDLIVVRTHDTVFVCHRNRQDDIKRLLSLVEQMGYDEYL